MILITISGWINELYSALAIVYGLRYYFIYAYILINKNPQIPKSMEIDAFE